MLIMIYNTTVQLSFHSPFSLVGILILLMTNNPRRPEGIRVRNVLSSFNLLFIKAPPQLNYASPSDELAKTKTPNQSKWGTLKTPLCAKALRTVYRPKLLQLFTGNGDVSISTPYSRTGRETTDKSNRPQTYLSTPDLPIDPKLTYRPQTHLSTRKAPRSPGRALSTFLLCLPGAPWCPPCHPRSPRPCIDTLQKNHWWI